MGTEGRADQSEPEGEMLLYCRPPQAPFPAGFDTGRWGWIGAVEESQERRGGLRERAREVLPCRKFVLPAASGRWLDASDGSTERREMSMGFSGVYDFVGCYC